MKELLRCVKICLVPYEAKLMNSSSFQENALVHDCLWDNILPESIHEIPGDSLTPIFSLSLSLNKKWYAHNFNIVSYWGT